MTIFFYVVLSLFVACIFLFFWMRWRMRASKGKFALAVVSTMLTCLLSGLSAMASSLPTAIVSKVSEAVGWGAIESSAPSILVVLLTIFAIFFIYRFGTTTVKNWDAAPRVSEIDLGERYLDNSIAALSLEQLRLLFRGQPDPLASDAVANWKEKIAEPPSAVPISVLLRDMLVEAMNEIRLPDDGWREEGKLWVGEKLGLRAQDTKSVLVIIFNEKPDPKSIRARLDSLVESYGSFDDFEFIGLYMSDGPSHEVMGSVSAGGKSIRIMSSRELVLMGLDLVNYARTIIDTFERTKVGGTNATLENSYVELNITTGNKTKEPETLATNLAAWLCDTSGKQIAVTGEYGQGKSTGLLKFCYDWAKQFVETQSLNERVPLLIELRGQSPSETDPLGFLSPWCARHRLSPRQVYNLIKSGDAIVIFEGFDELRNSGRAYHRHQHFNALWKFAFPGTKILFTGRPNFFLDEAEANRTLRNQESRKLGGDLYTDVWKLQKLTPPQIVEACRNYDEAIAEGISASVYSNAEFQDIVCRPSMLPVVATIWSDIDDLRISGNQLTGAALIEKYIQAVFARKEAELERDQNKLDAPTGSRYLVLPKQIREFLTICVAWRMSGLKLKNTISRAEITEMIRDCYDMLLALAKSNGVSPEIADRMIDFDTRYRDENPADRIEAIAAEICSSGLLVPDPAGGSSNLRFPHKQFFEFFVAKAVAIKSNKDTKNAALLLDKCSSGTALSARLNNEPNAVSYLAECVGSDLGTISSKWQRVSLRIYISQLIATHMLLRPLFQRIEKKSKDKTDELSNRKAIQTEQIWAFERLSQKMIIMAGPITMFWAMTFFGGGFFGLLNIDGFVQNILGNLDAGDGLTSTLIEDGTIRLFVPTQLLTVLTLILFPATMTIFMANSISDSGFAEMVFAFLNTHWEKSGEVPSSRIAELKLAALSLTRGRVQFLSDHNDATDYDRFLYPADELGRGLD